MDIALFVFMLFTFIERIMPIVSNYRIQLLSAV